MLKENHLTVSKTARYYTIGELSRNTRYIWFLIHGYGQSAADFIGQFEKIHSQQHFLIAPEGLNRFYWNGFSGNPVAAWMTSADRLHEIADYISYLNSLYQKVIDNLPDGCKPEINMLGFSQGATTLSRWYADAKIKADKLIFWAGGLAHDLHWQNAAPLFNQTQTYLFYGTNDPLISEENLNLQTQLLHLHQIQFSAVSYEGKHEIHLPTFLKYFDK